MGEAEPRIKPERIRQIVHDYLRSEGLTRLYLIDFRLPSEELRSRRIASKNEVKKILELPSDTRKKLDSLRVSFYNALHRIGAFLLGEKMWAIPPELEGEFARATSHIINEINRILLDIGAAPRRVRLVEVYAPSRYVVESINSNIKKLRQRIEDIEARIAEEKEKGKVARQLRRQLQELQRQLAMLDRTRRMILKQISSVAPALAEEAEEGEEEEVGLSKLKA